MHDSHSAYEPIECCEADRDEYERGLRRRQQDHLRRLNRAQDWQPCLHDQCGQCHGTGQSVMGQCIHMISCPCPRCSFR